MIWGMIKAALSGGVGMDDRLPKKITRRTFLSASGKIALGAAGVIAASSALFYYGAVQRAERAKLSGRSEDELPDSFVKLGELDQLTAHTSAVKVSYEAAVHDAWVQQLKKGFVYVTKAADGELLVLSSVCTHLGCDVQPATVEQRSANAELVFRCPCHGAEFDAQGRAIRVVLQDLDTYEPVLKGKEVYIDISSPVKRPGRML
jgi:menaquinol-cytochrome c reductase iron-sulfur subunit